MKSVFFRDTGKLLEHPSQRSKLPEGQIARGGRILEAEFLEDTRGINLLNQDGNVDARLNTAGDTADLATGYQVAIDTLTYVSSQVSKQKFFEVAPADYLPLAVGEGAYAASLLFNRSYTSAEDFEAGIIRQGTADARLSVAEGSMDTVTQKTNFWAKALNYTIIEVNQALLANSWDPVQAKMESRKKNWDLGIQITAFLGLATNSDFPGLLNNSAFNVNTAIIVKYISAMSAAELATFLAAFIPAYVTNVGSSAMPDTLIMPQIDYIACSQLMVPGTVGTYPVNLLTYLEDAFKKATRNTGFTILPLYYADKTVNNTLRALNKNYYVLYRRDPRSLRMNIPINYTTMQAGTINNFQFQAVAMGQFTGVLAIAALEALVFTF